MKFLDLFSGIGGFRLGLERSGHAPVGYVEIDKFARQSYQAMYDTTSAQKSINWTIFIQLLRQHLRYDCDYKN